MFLIPLVIVLAKARPACVVTSLCELCSSDERDMKYCARTGRRVEYTCANATRVFRSCDHTPHDDAVLVMRFEGWMLLIGGLSLYVVQRRKKRHQSLYDRRAAPNNWF